MSWIESIAEYLEDNNYGVAGTSLFIGQIPDVSAGVLLTEYDGNIIETNASGIALYQPSLQIRVHGEPEDYTTPRDKLKAIQAALAGITNQTVNGTYFLRIKPSTTILSLGQDEALAFQFSANFEVTYDE
jgi:hypothetical protein